MAAYLLRRLIQELIQAEARRIGLSD